MNQLDKLRLLGWRGIVFAVLAAAVIVWAMWPGLARVDIGADSAPVAVKGHLDLSDWELENGSLYLNGEWAFYWKRLAEPADLPLLRQNERTSSDAPPVSYIKVPGVWGSGNTAAPDRTGYGTYSLHIRFNEDQVGKLTSIYLRSAASAYMLYVNDKWIGGNGTVGASLSKMVPKNYAKVYTFVPQQADNEILIQVSNHVQRKGGLWTRILIGNTAAVASTKNISEAYQLGIAVALMTLGLYHLSVLILRKKDRLSMMIGFACLVLSIRSLLLGDTLLVKFMPDLNWEWTVKTEYWCVAFSLPLFAKFIQYLYPNDVQVRALRAIYVGGIALALGVLATPARVFTYGMWLFEAYVVLSGLYLFYGVLLAVLRQRVGARLCLFGGIMILLFVLHDLLYYNQLIYSQDLAPLGVLLFFFVQTLVVTLKFSKAYDDVERLSGMLSEVNLRLEEKIRERTQALEVSNTYLVLANEHLNKVEHSRRELIANVTHELGTPMTSIQGYMKALLDGVVQPDRQYIQIIYEKIQVADRLVQDLFDLTKLEEGHTSFHRVDVIVEELFDEHFALFRLDVENQGLSFTLEKPACPEDMLAVINVDPIRIRQVLSNLIANALNYTPSGGSIALMGAFTGDRLILSVTDTGVGIEPEVLPLIFDRFYKGSGPRHGGKSGSGLGLAIAREIVVHHGGRLTADSKPGEGSTFTFDMPVEFIPMVVD